MRNFLNDEDEYFRFRNMSHFQFTDSKDQNSNILLPNYSAYNEIEQSKHSMEMEEELMFPMEKLEENSERELVPVRPKPNSDHASKKSSKRRKKSDPVILVKHEHFS